MKLTQRQELLNSLPILWVKDARTTGYCYYLYTGSPGTGTQLPVLLLQLEFFSSKLLKLG